MGVDSKVGATMVSQCLGKIMGRRGKKILVILQGNYKGFEYIDFGCESFSHNVTKTIDVLRESNNTPWDMIKPQIFTHGNVSYLLLSVDRGETLELDPSHMRLLLETAKEHFQYVVYDGGCQFDSGASIGALEVADRVVVVCTQQQKSLDRLEKMVREVLTPLGVSGDLIINKYVDGSYGTVKEISSAGRWQQVHTLPYISYGWDCEASKSTLLKFPRFSEKVKQYEKTI